MLDPLDLWSLPFSLDHFAAVLQTHQRFPPRAVEAQRDRVRAEVVN
jgi:hypothetical protein